MIKDFELYHGIVLTRLIHESRTPIMIKQFIMADNASYIINNKIGMYIKYCTKRITPWRFTFLKANQDTIQEMKNCLAEVYLVLVCNKDGIVVLNWNSLKEILDKNHEDFEWVCVSRGRNKMYSVSGTDGKLCFKVSRSSFPWEIYEKI